MTDPAASKRASLAAFCLLCFPLLLSLFLSRHRIMWSDELFSWMLVTDPSFRHMLQAWNVGADGGGVLFYLVARLWLDLFGHTVAALRLFSAAGVAVAAALTFRIARSSFGWQVAFVSVAVVWFSSEIVLWQVLQGRFYGMLLAAVALGVYLFVLAEQPLTRRLLLVTNLCHTLLVATHPFGLVYSGVILLAMLASDFFVGRRRLRLYLAVVTGWWILIPSLGALRSSAAVGRPHFWTVAPTLADLGSTYACWSLLSNVLLGGLCAAFLVLPRLPQMSDHVQWDTSGKRPLAFVCGALLLVPIGTFVVSQWGTSVFVDRYLLPIVIPMSILLCQLFSTLNAAFHSAPPRLAALRRVPEFAGIVLLGITLWIAVVLFPSYWKLPGVDTNLQMLPMLPRGIPIVVEPVDLFDQLLAYHRQAGYNFVYLLDWENVNAPSSPRGEVSGYHEMENWKKVGYFSGSILDSDSFLAHTPVFAVVDNANTLLFERKIRTNPDFQIESLGVVHRDVNPANDTKLWLVRSLAATRTGNPHDADGRPDPLTTTDGHSGDGDLPSAAPAS